jgi:antitoxin component of RelBE/YafQ-DinJ toxin-antitoxin module
LENYLVQLNSELARNNVTGEICIVGGAAMMLAFGSRHSTRDIDALVIAPAAVRAAAQKVARDNQIVASWLNDGVKGFASGGSFEARELLALSHLRVVMPPPEYILAMKCISARVGIDENDKADTEVLIRHLGLKNSEAVFEVLSRFYDESRIPAKTRYFVEEICNELFAKSKDGG